jgi:hypothetical protein
MIESELLVLLFDPFQRHHLYFVLSSYPVQKILVYLQMHFFPDCVLMAKLRVDVVHGEIGVFWFLVLLVVSEQRDIVHFVLFAFGRLTVLHQELLLRVIVHVLDIVDVEASLAGLLAVPSHIESTHKPPLDILRHFL